MKSDAATLAALILCLGTQGAIAKDPALLSLNLEHFRDTASVTDDPANDLTTISTERGFAEHWGPLHMVWNDEFLKGIVDHKTAQKSFEIDISITYSGAWRSYRTANYQAMTGPISVPPTLVKKETTSCVVGECTYTEHLAFPIEERLLRQLAATYTPGKPTLWTYKLVATGGPDYEGHFSNAEIAGLLAKVDGYTRAPSVVKADTTAPRRLDIGISGIAVSPSADMPNRAGVLVVGVNSGSVAQKAGIITGDIIYKFDARPIKSLPELEAAVAASATNSSAVIQIYRGIDDTALTVRF